MPLDTIAAKCALIALALFVAGGSTHAQMMKNKDFENPEFVGHVIRTETFDHDPGWVGAGNVDPTIGTDFGYRMSDHTGSRSGAGEGGGTIVSSGHDVFYADTDFRVPMTFDQPLRAEAEFAFAPVDSVFFDSGFAGTVLIGHRNKATSPDQAGPRQFVGIELLGDESGGLSARAALMIAGNDVRYGEPITGLGPDSAYTFSYAYEPAREDGILTVEFFDDDGTIGTSTITLTNAERAAGVAVDAFAIGAGAPRIDAAAAPVTAIDVFIDFVGYSVPDPMSCGPGCHAG